MKTQGWIVGWMGVGSDGWREVMMGGGGLFGWVWIDGERYEWVDGYG